MPTPEELARENIDKQLEVCGWIEQLLSTMNLYAGCGVTMCKFPSQAIIMSHIFISYSRRDISFAGKIVQALAENNLDTWIDWKSIPKGEDWEQEIYHGIEEADAFLFLISPDSVASQMCNREIAHAVDNGKRILPIVIRDTDPKSIHLEISKRNWIFCRDGQDDFNKAIEETRTTIHTDYEWLKYHTELQVKALKWEQKKDTSRLLRGKELREAEQQLAEINAQDDPQPTKLQREYILVSQRNEIRTRRQITIGLMIGLGVMVVLSFVAWGQRNIALAEANAKATALVNEENARATAQAEKVRAEEQAQIALARQLAAQSQSVFTFDTKNQIIGGLLAIQSMNMSPSVEANQILQKLTLPYFVNYLSPSGRVGAVTFSPDNRYIVAGECDVMGSGSCNKSIVRIWDATGKEISHITHNGDITSVVFSPNGKYVASGSSDGTILVWEAITGKEIARMIYDNWNWVSSIAFSPDGKYVLSGSSDGTARVWETATGKEIARMTHSDNVTSVAFSSDGKYVVSGSRDHTARVWEAATGNEIVRVTQDDIVTSVAFSPDGQYIVSGSSDARVWDAFNGTEISRMGLNGFVNSVTFSPNGRFVVLGGCAQQDGTNKSCIQGIALVWEAATGKEIVRVTNAESIHAVAFSKNGKFILSVAGNTVWVWDGATGKEVARMTHDGTVTSAAFSPDGKYVVSGDCYNGGNRGSHNWCYTGTVRVWESIATMDRFAASSSMGSIIHIWETISGKEIANMKHDDRDMSVDFSPDEKYVVSGDWTDNNVRVRETSTGKEIARMTHDEGVTSVAFSLDGKYIVSGSHDNTARVWEASTGKEIARMTHDSDVSSVAFSPDRKYVVSGSWDHTARVWEASTGKEIARMTYDGDVTYVVFSPDGKYVVSGSWNNARMWNSSTGKETVRLSVNIDGYDSRIFFSLDGRYLVYRGCDVRDVYYTCLQGSFRVWNSITGQEIAFKFHDDKVRSTALSPDDKYIASGWCDQRDNSLSCIHGSARIWNVDTGREIAHVDHDDLVISVAFSPDGKYVVSESDDGIIRVWMHCPEDLIFDACSRVTRNLTRAEWKQYIGDALPYHAVCPNLPIEPEVIITPTP